MHFSKFVIIFWARKSFAEDFDYDLDYSYGCDRYILLFETMITTVLVLQRIPFMFSQL